MCDHLSGTKYPDIIQASETHMVRLRAEEYEEVFYKLLHRVGHTEEEFNGDTAGVAVSESESARISGSKIIPPMRLPSLLPPTSVNLAPSVEHRLRRRTRVLRNYSSKS